MIRQGQKYEWQGRTMLAMENTHAPTAKVREIVNDGLSDEKTMGPEEVAASDQLVSMPMVYHGNQIP